jgi:hypothetical protein
MQTNPKNSPGYQVSIFVIWFIWLAGVAFTSCEEDGMLHATHLPTVTDTTLSEVLVIDSTFTPVKDPDVPDELLHFSITDVRVEDDSLALFVQYGGGCKRHQFKVVWDGQYFRNTIRLDGPDRCEALPTSALKIALSDFYEDSLILRAFPFTYEIKNTTSEQVVYFTYPKERQTATVGVKDVLCGDGVWKNRWLTPEPLEDPLYFQPAKVANPVKRPEKGKIYEIEFAFSVPYQGNKAICLAYPGPSKPIEIYSIREVDSRLSSF